MVKVSCQTEINSFWGKIGREGDYFEIRSGDHPKSGFHAKTWSKKFAGEKFKTSLLNGFCDSFIDTFFQGSNETVNNHKPFQKFWSALWCVNRDAFSPCSFYVRTARKSKLKKGDETDEVRGGVGRLSEALQWAKVTSARVAYISASPTCHHVPKP